MIDDIQNLYIILFFIIVIIIFLNYKPQKKEKFHHSRINTIYDYENPPKVNFFKFPLYYLTKPIVIEINEGECLYIPYKWWHWVFSSSEENIAMNQWFPKNNDSKNKPYKFKNTNYNPSLWHMDIIKREVMGIGFGGASDYPNICSFEKPDRVYPEELNPIKSFTNLANFIEISQSKKYLGFLLEDDIPQKYKNQLFNAKDVKKYNLWYYSNGANSGLHYDNYENYLCQMKGSKKVYLFPPCDSKYLYGDTKLKSNVF